MNKRIFSEIPVQPLVELEVAVLIATCDRPKLLANRALRSVARQTLRPDYIVVVDDSDRRHRATNRRIAADFTTTASKAVYLENYRTKGASGAWNTGLDWLTRRVADPSALFVAILDDDDAWEPNHLEVCLKQAHCENLDMVVAGIIRHEEEGKPPRLQSLPKSLDTNVLLVRSPHIQGSNLFVRLSTILQAGLFDEALLATTDRDLCIRLADLGLVRFGNVPLHTVHHHAEPTAGPRLCTRASPARRSGMDWFYRKYRGRMTPEIEAEFLDRAKWLFDCEPSGVPFLSHGPDPEDSGFKTEEPEPVAIVVGVITEPNESHRAARLLEDLSELGRDTLLSGLDVILLENGPRPSDGSNPVEALTVRMRREHGLRCFLIPVERQRRDAAAGLFGASFERVKGRLGLGRARLMVQTYVHLLAKHRPGAVAWILDDDKRLDALVSTGDEVPQRRKVPLVRFISELKKTGHPIVLGADTDSPPLPFSSAIRTQMVDLVHNLHWLSRLDPESTLPDRNVENAHARTRWDDYYYDLSRRETDHLESPFWIVPEHDGEKVREAFTRVARRVERILAGEQIFRPLCIDSPVSPLDVLPSIHRGGNTFVFDIEALRDSPTALLDLQGNDVRRADMIWALIQVHGAGRSVVHAPIPVRHDRSDVQPGSLDIVRLVADIDGYALYSALEDALLARKERRLQGGGGEVTSDLALDQADIDSGVVRYHKYVEERSAAFVLAFHRVHGLIAAAQRAIDPLVGPSAWWADDPQAEDGLSKLLRFLDTMADEYQAEVLENFRDRIKVVDETHVRKLFGSLSSSWRSPLSIISEAENEANSFLNAQRVENARIQVERLMGVRDLRVLGHGGEGVVFTDEKRVFKYFDRRSTHESDCGLTFIKEVVGRWTDAQALYPLQIFEEDGVHAVLVYPFEHGSPYCGGHGLELIRLIRECRHAGIACRNIHPDNLLVTDKGIRLIDYGSDIRPFDDSELEQMCRRAWLTWRWHHRPDLKELMKRSLRDPALPELDGYQRLREAVDGGNPDAARNDVVDAIVVERGNCRVLDYGCGKGKLADRLARRGMDVVAYDPEPSLEERWARSMLPAIRRGGRALRDELVEHSEQFDVVVCSLVVCTLDDGPEYKQLLNDLGQFVRHDGRVVLVVCNPFYTLGGSTPFQRKEVPTGAMYEKTFAWSSIVECTGNTVREVHRPLSSLRRDLLREGLAIESTRETHTVDRNRFEPASDFLVLTLRPVPKRQPSVSLMIKTCFMEHETIELQVRHLVRQLEEPVAFHERILVIDSRSEGFLRSYAAADEKHHATAVQRLLADGVIDKVVLGPTDQSENRRLYQRWFDVESTDTHAANEAQLASTLVGLENCSGQYVLQVDADIIVARRDRSHNYLADMVAVLRDDPEAITVAFNICHQESKSYTYKGQSGPWRTEVRAALLDREHLLRARPLPNDARDGQLTLPWHRSLDKHIAATSARSYRGGDNRTFFIHPPNTKKADVDEWMAVLDRVEQGFVPDIQVGHVDLQGGLNEWLEPKRDEPFIFLIAGRNVAPGRFRRCLDSVVRQRRNDWGAIIIDDGSLPGFGEYMKLCCAAHKDRITVLRLKRSRGKLANVVWALRHVCTNPESIIVTQDADDALIGDRVLDVVAAEYERGADVTVGSMLRTDKHKLYPVDFHNPRSNGGANIWLHLRTFRKKLFDEVPDEYLRVGGAYPRVANDWALMTAIVELAANPVHIEEVLYCHEPSGAGKAADRAERETIIGEIMAKPALAGRESA